MDSQFKEISIRKKNFLEILERLHHKIEISIKTNPQYNSFKNNNFSLFNDDLEFFANIENSNKTEEKLNPLGEIIYLSNKQVSKFDNFKTQNLFYSYLGDLIKKIKFILKESESLNYESIDSYQISDANYISFRNEIECFNWKNKGEFERFFRSNIDNSYFKEKIFLKFLKEFWVCLRNYYCNYSITGDINISKISQDLIERINLNFNNKGKRNYFMSDFELHKAVFENNLWLIRRICGLESTNHLYCDINEIDPMGNTPLMLAIKYNHIDSIKVLCDHDADIKHKSFDDDISPLEYVVNSKNEEILRILLNSVKKQKISMWENNKFAVQDILNSIGDFTMELKLQINSKILLFFNSLLPTEIFRITKKGANIRIDMNKDSHENNNGKFSILIKEKNQNLSIFKLDHIKKKCYDLIELIGGENEEDEKKIKKIMNEGVSSHKFISDLKFSAESSNDSIVNYKCLKFNGVCHVKLEDKKGKQVINSYSFQYKIFSKYFDEGLRKRFNLITEKQDLSMSENILKFLICLSCKLSSSALLQSSNGTKIEKNLNLKEISFNVWASESFPLKISQFMPLLHIMSFTNSEFSKLKSTLCSTQLPFSKFPLKISYPIGVSFYALLNVCYFNNNELAKSAEFDENIYLNKIDLNKFQLLDQNYAKDFYDKYYQENSKHSSDSINGKEFDLDISHEDIESLKINKNNKTEEKVVVKEIKDEKMKEPHARELKLTPLNIDIIINSSVSENSYQENNFSMPIFFNYQKEYFNSHLKKKEINEDNFEIDDDIPAEINKNSTKKKKIVIPFTPRKESSMKSKIKFNYNQKTLKCNLKPKLSSFISKTKILPDLKNEHESNASTSVGIKIKGQRNSPVKFENNFDIINNIQLKIFESKENHEIFKTSKMKRNKNPLSDFMTFCKKILK